MRTIRALLVDDNPAFLATAQGFLASHPEIEVVGAAVSAREALRLVAALAPDLVLMDLFMPEINGLEATRQIKAMPDAPRIIVVSLDDSDAFRTAAASRGADDFVSKLEMPTSLIPRIRRLFV